MGIKVFDFDNDGRMDIFITDMHSDMSQEVGPEHEREKSHMVWPEKQRGDGTASIWGNTFFHNQGGGRFREMSDEVGAENYWPWGLSTGDLNADGFEDVFITSGMNYPFRYAVNSLKLNNRGARFLDAEFILGVEPDVPTAWPRPGSNWTWRGPTPAIPTASGSAGGWRSGALAGHDPLRLSISTGTAISTS